MYIVNIQSGYRFSYKNQVLDHLDQTKELEEYYLKELGDTNYSEEDIKIFEDGYKDISEQSLWNEKILELAEQEKWSEALGYSLKILNRHIEVHEESGDQLFPPDYVMALKQEIALYEELEIINSEPDIIGYEKFEFNYTFRVMNSLFPLFSSFILCVLLTEIFITSYKKEIDIEMLFPSSYVGTKGKKYYSAQLFH